MCRSLPLLLRSIAATLLALAAAGLALPAAAADVPPRARVIVKFKPEAGVAVEARSDARSSERVGALGARRGVAFTSQRALGRRVRLVKAEGLSSQELARRLAADPEVAYAVPDRRMRPLLVPNDPLYRKSSSNSPEEGQWYLREPDGVIRSAIDAEHAWGDSKGQSTGKYRRRDPDDATRTIDAGVVVAVLDSGVRFNHPDLGRSSSLEVDSGGKLLQGYDFIRRVDLANDGNARDTDASDPGDWVTVAEVQADPNDDLTEDCVLDPDSDQLLDVNSDWHGTEVAGILGALTDNRRGMAGVGFDVKLLPARVLGKCGGFSSDIVLAMRWAAGIHVEDVPDNEFPAQVINLSLGGTGSCGDDYKDAIEEVTERNVAVVVSAGNSEGRAVSEPANCDGVIAVAGLRHSGTKVGFSDLGSEVAISAPGGNCVNGVDQTCVYPLLTTSDSGTQEPQGAIYTDGESRVTVGTSFSAPLVSGTLALAIAARSTLDANGVVHQDLTPKDLRALVQRTARDFPNSGAPAGTPECRAPDEDTTQDECYCTTDTCGAGMLDAAAAVAAAVGVIPRVTVVTDDPRPDETIVLSAADSLPTLGLVGNVTRAAWRIVDGNGIVDNFESASGLETSVRPSGGGRFTVELTATDSSGASAKVEETIEVSGGSGGNGNDDDDDNDWGSGALGVGWLAGLLAAVVAAGRAVRRGGREGRSSGG